MWQLRTKEEDKSLVTETTSLAGGPGTLTLVKEQASVLSLLNVELELFKSLWIRNQRSGRALRLSEEPTQSQQSWLEAGESQNPAGEVQSKSGLETGGEPSQPLPCPAPRMDGTPQSPLVPWLLELCSLLVGVWRRETNGRFSFSKEMCYHS